MKTYRDTVLKRKSLTETVKMRLWGRAAARCVLCSEWLIDGTHFWHDIPVGELAHVVAASSGTNAPRGSAPLDESERAQEENILLLCHSCHRVIDSEAHRDKYTVDFLKARKAEHERRVREVTNFPTLRPASVLSLQAQVRGTFSRVTPEQISAGLLRAGLTGLGADTRNGRFDVTLDQSEKEGWAWEAARSKIDSTVARINEAITGEDTRVIAVFAIAPIPVLTYLGSRLDDKAEIVLFPRQRVDSDFAWSWPTTPDPPKHFTVNYEAEPSDATDIVAIMNVSGTVNKSRVPTGLLHAPVLTIAPDSETPRPDLIDSVDTLNEFSAAWRAALATIEERWPKTQHIHILAAVPTTAAIMIGRYRMRDAHSAFVLYQRTDSDTYEDVMRISE